MTKIRLNTTHRDILRQYGQERISSVINRDKEKDLYQRILDGVNKAIRAKYPEDHMVILRQYKLARFDRCLRFQFPSGRVDGFNFAYEENALCDLPYNGGCRTDVVYPVNAAFEKAYDDYAKDKKVNDDERDKKLASFNALVDAAKTLEDVLAAIDLPAELQKQLGKQCTALVALSPDSLKVLKHDFALKKAA
jgi:hypothetical protein